MSNERDNQFIRLSKAAIALRVSPRWLQREALGGRIPAMDCGGIILVNLAAVRAALGERAANGRIPAHGTGTSCPPIPREGVQHG